MGSTQSGCILILQVVIGWVACFPVISGVGINYGTVGSHLPPPKKVAQLLQTTLINKVKIYDTNPDILEAFSNSGIDLIVAVENFHVSNISSGVSAADEWFSSRIAPFIPATSIVGIAVGNEYLTTATTPDADSYDYGQVLVEAMQNLQAVLGSRGLARKIKVSTPHSMGVLASSFPPSSSTFQPNLAHTMEAILGLLADNGGPFMVNAYPYFAYRDNPSTVDLQYALLGNSTTTTSPSVKDPKGYVYTNMLDAQIDAVRSAINALGFGNRTVDIAVSESGWPSKGGFGASPENARAYNARLIERAQSNRGTPMKPRDRIDIFVFSLFNENQKKGSPTEKNFGIFTGDGSMVYDLDLSCDFCSTLSNNNNNNENSGGGRSKIGFGDDGDDDKKGWSRGWGGRGPSVWCVAKPHADEKVLQAVVDFCCGPGGVDCREIYEKGNCYQPGRIVAHASYAMNAYYQMHGRNYWNCLFNSSAIVTFSDPSYGACRYPQQ